MAKVSEKYHFTTGEKTASAQISIERRISCHFIEQVLRIVMYRKADFSAEKVTF